MIHIIKETASGTTLLPLVDETFARREIYLSGEITDELADDMTRQVRYLAGQNHDPITVYINSPGGNVSAGLAIYDVLMSCGCTIHTVVAGEASSMAAVILMAGETRHIYRHGMIFIHDPREISYTAVTPELAQERLKILHDYRSTIARIMSERSGQDERKLRRLMKDETRIDAAKAVELNLCTEMIT